MIDKTIKKFEEERKIKKRQKARKRDINAGRWKEKKNGRKKEKDRQTERR